MHIDFDSINSKELVNLNLNIILMDDFEKGVQMIESSVMSNSQGKFYDIIFLDYLFINNNDEFNLSDEFIVDLVQESKEKTWIF